MKALILVGGYGTRLRPLTLSVPKPLIHFCNRPIVEYQIRALVAVGVKTIILAVSYKPEEMKETLAKLESQYDITIMFSVETTPMGTAGAIKLAQDLIMSSSDGDNDDLLFVLNSDIIMEYPFDRMIEQMKQKPCLGTICTTTVTEPSKFGVILSNSTTNQIKCFIEKPTEWVGNCINAGVYLFNRSVLEYIEKRPTSMEREIFPMLASEGQICSYNYTGYWADIGKPRDFLIGTQIYLSSKYGTETGEMNRNGYKTIGNVEIHCNSSIGAGSCIGPNVVIGSGCEVGRNVRLSNCTVMPGCKIGCGTRIDDSIVGWHSNIGNWVRVEGLTVIGQDVTISDEKLLSGVLILPHKTIAEDSRVPGSVIM